MNAEEVREATKAGALFEAVIAPAVKDCAWGEIEWRDGVLAGFSKDIAEQCLIRQRGGVKEAWLVIYTEAAEKAVEEAKRRGYKVAEKGRGEGPRYSCG